KSAVEPAKVGELDTGQRIPCRALPWLWCGFGVALVWLWCGFGVALGWLWCGFGGALVGLTRFDGHLGGQCAWVFCLVYLFLEVHRSLVAQRTVAALAMVIGFHIGEEVAARLGAGGIASTP